MNPSHDEVPETAGHVMRWAVPVYDWVNALILLNRRYRRLLRRHGDLSEGLEVLDVGCGTGNLLRFAQEQTGNGLDAHGIDPSPWMLEKAVRKSERLGFRADFRPGVIEEIPFPDGSMDRVFCTLMFHHLPAGLQEKGLREIRRVLRPGGFLLLVDFAAVRNPMFAFFAVHALDATFRNQMLGGLLPVVNGAGFSKVERVEKWMFAVEVIKARV